MLGNRERKQASEISQCFAFIDFYKNTL